MFPIKTYGKSEFAMMMFPDISDPKIAQNKLRRWIKLDPKLHKQIRDLSRTVNDNDYSPAQIRLMIDKWGAPGEYDDY